MAAMEPVSAAPLPVIGVIRTRHTERERTPLQASLNRAEHATVEIAEPYRDGLDGLDGFDYAWLLTWLHRSAAEAGPVPLRQVPYLLRPRNRKVGVFATRGPRRVNPIGLSLIQVLEVTPAGVSFAGVDMVDGTPVLDLKPYVTRFDRPPGQPRCGWLDDLDVADGITPADLLPADRSPAGDPPAS
jgi:tRNA-Thr(GGU) m(6)t(6)A37 methyltransferase TsaA